MIPKKLEQEDAEVAEDSTKKKTRENQHN